MEENCLTILNPINNLLNHQIWNFINHAERNLVTRKKVNNVGVNRKYNFCLIDFRGRKVSPPRVSGLGRSDCGFQ